ncbi:MAG: methionine--tRNA ligase [Pseudanabaenaceae cyanobacterium]
MPAVALTTPLYYVNDLPHMGSAYPTIAADALARFYRMTGTPTLFVTGCDEHGQKIQQAAAKLNRTPQEHCDLMVEGFKSLWQLLDIQYDRFVRTTDARHYPIVKEFFQRVYERGDIYPGQQQGWYCVACEEFKEERELLEGNKCPIHPTVTCEWRDETNYFFRLSRYQEALEELYRQQPDFIQPQSRRNEVVAFVQQGLRDFSISRYTTWGFPVPIDESQTLYVWFDALLGYITALLEPQDAPTLANALKTWYPIHVHIIGKDILRFHAVYWPAMLMSAGLPLPRQVFGHGFLTKDGLKMGKTLGNTIDPFALVKQYGADAVRYFFLKEIEFGKDGDFSEQRFVEILNADLANSLGNLLNRSLGMVCKYCDSKVPSRGYDLSTACAQMVQQVQRSYEVLAFQEVCQAVLAVVREGNKLIDDRAPWKLYKAGAQAEVEQILYSVLEALRLVGLCLYPITPSLSSKIWRQLHLEPRFLWTEAVWGGLEPGRDLPKPQPLFERIEVKQ